MKRLLSLLCFFLWTSLTFGQAKEQELSNAEKFSSKSGTLMQKEFLRIGELKNAKLDVIYFTDLIVNQKQSAVRFEYEVAGKYSNDTKRAVLDSDEMDGFIKSIRLMQEKIFPTTPTYYSEVTYKSRGGFEAGCFWSKGNWSTYLKLEKFDNDSYVFLLKEDFPRLLELLELAKAKL